MNIRDLGKAIGDFELNNIPKFIVAIIALAVWGVYLAAKLVVKLWYVYFGLLLAIYYGSGGIEIGMVDEDYAEYYYQFLGVINISKEVLIMPIVGTAIFFTIRHIVRKTAHFFE